MMDFISALYSQFSGQRHSVSRCLGTATVDLLAEPGSSNMNFGIVQRPAVRLVST